MSSKPATTRNVHVIGIGRTGAAYVEALVRTGEIEDLLAAPDASFAALLVDIGEDVSPMLQQEGDRYLRTKGVFNAKGFDEKVVFQSVRMLTSMARHGTWPAEGARRTEYVVIGRDLDRDMLVAGLTNCVRA